MLCSSLAASQQEKLTEQQTKGDMYWQCLSSEQWLSNPHMVARAGQCVSSVLTFARYTRSKPLPTQTQWHGGGGGSGHDQTAHYD